FNCAGPSGAVLGLPHGAHLEKLENLARVRQYAAKHAQSWYQYANGTRGRGLTNGSLHLVTGCEKTKSWGIASFQDVTARNEFQLSFKPSIDADFGSKYRWQSGPGRQTHKDPPPLDGTPLNQTTFIHALTISLGEGIWGNLFGHVEISELGNSQSPGLGREVMSYRPQGSSLFSSFSGLFSGLFQGGAPVEGRSNTDQVGGITLSNAAPLPQVRVSFIESTQKFGVQ
ncbi:hypothetical protein FB451DRAFT_1033570, partial [Mycena latifolia]